jgi:hypothetical protein
VPTKTTHLANGQEGYLNLQAENTTDFNSISTDDMNRQSVIMTTLHILTMVSF